MQVLAGLFILFFAAIFALGWIVLLILGIVKLKKGVKTAGTVLTILGSAWGFLVICTVGVGIYFAMNMAKTLQGEPFDPSTYKGNMGKIVTPYHGPCHLNAKETATAKLWRFSSQDGDFTAPVGNYQVAQFSAEAESENGTHNTANSLFDPQNPTEIRVQKDSDSRLETGPPYTVSVDVGRERANNITFRLSYTDSSGHPSSVFYTDREAPKFAVLDSAGNTLWTGAFEYG